MNGKSTEITLNPVITAGAYSANDVAGGLLVFTLPDAFPIPFLLFGSLCRHKRRPQCYNRSGNFPVL